MTTVKLLGEHISDYTAAVIGYTTQALPYRLSKAMGAARRQLKESEDAYWGELLPFVQKHTGGNDSMPANHPSYPAFRREAADVLSQELEVELEPIPLSLIDEAAEIMQKRADKGLGDPLVIVFETQEALIAAGIIVEDEPEKPAKKRAKTKR